MSKTVTTLAAAAFAALAAQPASAQLIARKDLSLATAQAAAQAAYQSCASQGYKISVAVVDRAGVPVVVMRGDDAAPHTYENSIRKAYTARTFRAPSSEFEERVRKAPTTSQIFLANIIAAQGGIPIKVGEDTIGAVGVSGAPGGGRDEVCAKVGVEKIADQLK